MAPNSKKKKKPVSNPARGFATTSTASKVKVSNVAEIIDEPNIKEEALNDETSNRPAIVFSHDDTGKNVEEALHELSPEELEKQLEESTLQVFVESHSNKIKREVSRQVAKLQTERRILRAQSVPLSTRQWLPPDILQLILDLLSVRETKSDGLCNGSNIVQGSADITDDDLLVKLWTLRRLLPQLGFSLTSTDLALRHLLDVIKTIEPRNLSATKDSVWGFEECLSWLALVSAPEELPEFDQRDVQRLPHRGQKYKGGTTVIEEGWATATSTSEGSRPANPPQADASSKTDDSPDGETLPSSQSESDSELEPEGLIEKYLGLQRRLYEISPALFQPDHKSQKAGKSPKNTRRNHDLKVDPVITRLTAKLNRIQADILFDEDEATRQWAEIHIDIVREAADRKRLGLRHGDGVDQSQSSARSALNASDRNVPDSDKGVDDMLGGLFANPQESSTVLTAGVSGIDTLEAVGATVNIRDFGNWTGLSPRRVFEEACKSRDPSARISYKVVSSSTFSKRHSIEVRWSREQTSSLFHIEGLANMGDSRGITVEMMSIACPDSVQSEAFVSTAALFLVFASSAEEKIYLRLPSVWRELWEDFCVLKREHNDAKDRDTLRELRNMIDTLRYGDDPVAGSGTDNTTSSVSKMAKSESGELQDSSQLTAAFSDEMRAIWRAKESMPSYQNMLSGRMNLPIFDFKGDLLHAIKSHQIVIICGETGCGKSTQVPAYILEHELSSGRSCKIYCTEPRRISAISLARRVSEELGERKGDVGTFRSLVGFAIRLESHITTQTRLVYATTGIVMRMLEGSNELGGITHLVLDEIHERGIDSDFLLIALRKLLRRRPDLKVILMSATVDAQRFSDYLGQAPILNVPGRTFPVETKYLEDAIEETQFKPATTTGGGYGDDEDDIEINMDGSSKTSLSADNMKAYSADTCNALLKCDEYRVNYDLILKLLVTIATVEKYSFYSKAVLVFLPGIAEIRRLNDMLAGHQMFRNGWYVYALHSNIATDEQEQAFLVPPQGTRKIVLATNIAETGITIPDVTCVIDTGKHKEMRFDERRQLSRLIEVFISRANAKQRRGRAGRVQKGLCFHLYTKNRHDNILLEEQTPEMLRLSLQDLVLRVKICKLGGIEQTLSEALDAPSSRNIRRAIDSLVDVKALTNAEDLTPLGRQLARLPLDVFLGKLILLGTMFGCLDAMLTVAAILSSKSPFAAPMGARSQMDTVRLAFRKGDSDLLTVYNAYCAWRRICNKNVMPEHQFCRKNFLSSQTLSNIEDLKTQLTTSLVDAGFVKLSDSEKLSLNKVRYYSRKRNFVEIPGRYNSNDDNDLILNSVIAWSFYPKLLRRDGKGWKNVANNQSVSLHPTSVNKGMDRLPQWLSFYHIMQSSNKFYNAHETSPVEDFAVALVCGEAEFKMYSGVIVVDGNRIRFSLDDWRAFSIIRMLRMQIRQIMAQSFRNPGRTLSSQQQEWLGIWQKIFTLKEKSKA